MVNLKLLKKEEHAKAKVSMRQEITKIKAEIKEVETFKAIQRINESKCCFFKKINARDKPLDNLTKKKKRKDHTTWNQK